jgi:hypothetical protein
MNQPISTRKARLVRCEICRRLYGSHFDAPLWDVLEIATQYADRLVTESVREQAEKHLRHEIPERYGFAPVWWQYALACIEEDEDSDWPGDYGSEHRGLPRDESVPLVAAHCYHEIFGNPFRPVAFSPEWRTSDVMLLANGIYTDRAFDRMPVLADALQEAGCDSDDLLNHLRDPHAVHVRGCWALDLVLGKE